MSVRIAVARWPRVKPERIALYGQALIAAGAEPIDLTEPSLENASALLLTGGRDIDASLYGEQRHAEADEPDPGRDAFELTLLRRALEIDMPVLAICRGHQLLNVAMGGSLVQHIESGKHVWLEDEAVSSQAHSVMLQPGLLSTALGADGLVEVNSRHHQGVTPERLGRGLRVTATSDDGFIEAVDVPDRSWVVGIQWHPERPEPGIAQFDTTSRRLFDAFVARARER